MPKQAISEDAIVCITLDDGTVEHTQMSNIFDDIANKGVDFMARNPRQRRDEEDANVFMTKFCVSKKDMKRVARLLKRDNPTLAGKVLLEVDNHAESWGEEL